MRRPNGSPRIRNIKTESGGNLGFPAPPPVICDRLQADLDAGRGNGTSPEMAERSRKWWRQKRDERVTTSVTEEGRGDDRG